MVGDGEVHGGTDGDGGEAGVRRRVQRRVRVQHQVRDRLHLRVKCRSDVEHARQGCSPLVSGQGHTKAKHQLGNLMPVLFRE